VGTLDAVTLGLAAALMAAATLMACCVPAWRAVRVEPSVTLKAE
jgi:ABC-type lipoprotein release transport system permease subunit